jgi:RimJ/RimL family protein N-acetyltransferase
MQHNFTLYEKSFKIRPINNQDAEFCLTLRNNPVLNSFLNSTSTKVEDQINWLEKYYEKDDDFYFVIEKLKDNTKEGLIALYDIDFENKTAEWGRWILMPGSLAAVESALMIYKFAFHHMNLEKIYSRTVSLNEKTVSFHDSCGIIEKKILKNYFNFNGNLVNSIQHTVTKDTVDDVIFKLENLSKLLFRKS